MLSFDTKVCTIVLSVIFSTLRVATNILGILLVKVATNILGILLVPCKAKNTYILLLFMGG